MNDFLITLQDIQVNVCEYECLDRKCKAKQHIFCLSFGSVNKQ